MKLLAIDPGSTVMGYAVFDGETLLEHGDIDCSRQPFERRAMCVLENLNALYRRFDFTDVACEKIIRYPGRSVPALEVTAKAIKLWAEKLNLPFSVYMPSQWKASAVGHGNATKEQTIYAMCLLYGCAKLSEHEADALGIAGHHLGICKYKSMEAK